MTATVASTSADVEAARAGGPARRLRQHHWATPYLLLLPYLVLLLARSSWGPVFGIWISLHDWDFLLPNKPWVGLQNYVNLFDPESVTFPFWKA